MKSTLKQVSVGAALLCSLVSSSASADELVSLRGVFAPTPTANEIVRLTSNGTVDPSFLIAPAATGPNDLSGPTGMAYGPNGNVYVASYFTGEVLEYSGQTGAFIAQVASGLNGPSAVRFSGDNMYVTNQGQLSFDPVTFAESYNGTTISKFSVSPTTGAATPVDISGTSLGSSNSGPLGLAFDSSNNVYVAEFNNNNVSMFNSAGALVQTIGTGSIVQVGGVTISPTGNLDVSSAGTNQILEFALPATALESPTTLATLSSEFFPGATMWLDSTHLLIGSSFGSGIEVYDTMTHTLTTYQSFADVALATGGQFAVADMIAVPVPVPEPGSVSLAIVAALAGLMAYRRRSSRRRTVG